MALFEQPFALTDRAALIRFAEIPGTARDAEADSVILAVSRQVENFLDCRFRLETRTEDLDIAFPGHRTFDLQGKPIASITSVQHDLNRDFVGGQLISATDFSFDPDMATLTLDSALTPGERVLRVVYVAGVATAQALRSVAPDIERATLIQAKHVMDRMTSPGGESSVSEQGGSIRTDAMQLLRIVREILRPYQRISYGP